MTVRTMLTLYGHPSKTAANTLKLRAALAEASAPYEYVAVDLAKGEQKRPEFLALNPHGKVPVLVDDGFALPESDAILWYIADRFPAARLVPPYDGAKGSLQARARVLEWCDFVSTGLAPAVYDIYLHTSSRPPEKRIAEVAEVGRQRLERAAGVLEQVLSTREYLAGAFSIADIAGASLVFSARQRVAQNPLAGGAIDRWYARIEKRPAWQAATAG